MNIWGEFVELLRKISVIVPLQRLKLAIKAAFELGLGQLCLFALYRVGLKSGYFKAVTPEMNYMDDVSGDSPIHQIKTLLELPDPEKIKKIIGEDGLTALILEADEIVDGKFRLFGGDPVLLRLDLKGKLSHWTDYETGKAIISDSHFKNYPAQDIKFVWEPARFGWAITLARAYHLTRDERYPQAFWRYFDEFHAGNPVNVGPHWISAQEVGFRLIALGFCDTVFVDSPSYNAFHRTLLATSVATHARRIMTTLVYARAQKNNHLLSEAAGLITASIMLPAHPERKRWKRIGWKWLNRGLVSQINDNGEYIQNSTNYHRLMLQIALWINSLHFEKPANSQSRLKSTGKGCSRISFTKLALFKLELATEWLMTHIDIKTGRAPNLGPNDGANLFPLSLEPIFDYRPVVQAAARAFVGRSFLDPGTWDEMSLWFNLPNYFKPPDREPHKTKTSSDILRQPGSRSWVYLRASNIFGRPGHADQLHIDLWWQGLNIAQDAGTYLYNSKTPWDNSLTHTAVHNTIMVDHMEQMTRAGRFLYLDRAQGEIMAQDRDSEESRSRLSAWHDGYSRLGVLHSRQVSFQSDVRLRVDDYIQKIKKSKFGEIHDVRLHWLLPDWEFDPLETGNGLRLRSPFGWINLFVTLLKADQTQMDELSISIVRAGELVHGTGPVSPTWGWVSPTYGEKIPAISFAVRIEGKLPLVLISEWDFPM